MGIFRLLFVLKYRVAAERMFKALVTDMDSIPPPAAINSIDVLRVDGTRGGTIRKTNFVFGVYVIHEIKVVDIEKYLSKHTLIERPMIGGNIKLIRYNSKFEDSSDGGCIEKISCKYYIEDDIKLTDEEIKFTGDQILAFYKITQEYLLAYPDVCT